MRKRTIGLSRIVDLLIPFFGESQASKVGSPSTIRTAPVIVSLAMIFRNRIPESKVGVHVLPEQG